MKRKLLSCLVIIFALCTCLFTLTACGGKDPETPKITSSSGIVIEGHEFEDGCAINFNYVDDQSVIELTKTALSAQDYVKTSDIHVINLAVIKDSVTVQPDKSVAVSIPTSLIPNLDLSLNYVIFHIKGDSSIERLSATISNGKITFNTSSFSYFILAEKNLDPIGPTIDNQTDLEETDKDNYFTSKSLSLVTEINGSYTIDKPFTIDKENTNKRIYDNLYLYQYDYFFMISSDYKDIWCKLSDKNDLLYLEVESEQGEDIQVNVKVSGIYTLVFDTVTKSFDVEYISQITTPVYEEIAKCEIGYLDDNDKLQFVKMQKEGDTLVAKNIHMNIGQSVGFYSEFTHTSWYKTTLDESCANKYVYKNGQKPSSEVYFIFGGTYNIYLNAKTYVVNVELVSVDTDGYSAIIYEDNQFKNLELADNSVNYIFTHQMVVTSITAGNYEVVTTTIPEIYNASYQEYNLTLTEDSLPLVRISNEKTYFKTAGTYTITINLKTLEMSLTLLAE